MANKINEIHVTLTGTTPLLLHADNIDWADQMDVWRKNTQNKKISKAGDDRTPSWRWVGCLHHDNGVLVVPSENIMKALMEGAAQVPTGKGQKTYKSQSQSGLLCSSFSWPLMVSDQTVNWADIQSLCDDELTFNDQVKRVEKLGFELFVKRARIGTAKHIRVRPRFAQWSCSGAISIIDPQITVKTLHEFLTIAGQYKGLGDWRPGAKTPGPFGMFTATVDE